jgi:acetyltransferase-like isoleucine patch superfamily enzyme
MEFLISIFYLLKMHNLKIWYKKLKRGSMLRMAIFAGYRLIVYLFNTTVNFLPHNGSRILLCKITGINIGKNVMICRDVVFLGLGNCSIGSGTIINSRCIIDNRGSLCIGENVSISMGSTILTQGHDIDDELFPVLSYETVIDDYACIFSNSIIYPGVKIGKGAVIFPGSVVIKNIQDLEVVGGNPIKLIRFRKTMPSYKLSRLNWFI